LGFGLGVISAFGLSDLGLSDLGLISGAGLAFDFSGAIAAVFLPLSL
jgi:hypothetical protein